MKTALRYLFAWAVSVIVCAGLGSIISTQRVIGGLSGAGASIGLSDRISMTVFDLQHFGTLYGMFIFIAFLIAFAAGLIVFRLAKFGRPIVFVTAGAAAIFVMLWSMQQVFFGTPIVAGARDLTGVLWQVFAGGLGGLAFHKLTLKPA